MGVKYRGLSSFSCKRSDVLTLHVTTRLVVGESFRPHETYFPPP